MLKSLLAFQLSPQQKAIYYYPSHNFTCRTKRPHSLCPKRILWSQGMRRTLLLTMMAMTWLLSWSAVTNAEDPSNLAVVGSWPHVGSAAAFTLDDSGQFAFVGAGQGIHVLDVTDTARPKEIARIDAGGPVLDLIVSGNRLFAATGENGIAAFDVSVPQTPLQGPRFNLGHEAERIVVYENFLIAVGISLSVIDVSNPQNFVLKTTRPGENYTDIRIAGPTIFLQTDHSGISIAEITASGDINVIGQTPYISDTWDFRAIDQRLYVAHNAGLTIFDISDISSIVQLGFYEIIEAKEIAIDGNLLYLSTSWCILNLDVSNPADIRPIAPKPNRRLGHSRDMILQGNRLFALASSGLIVLDVSDPIRWHELGKVSTWERSRSVQDVAVQGSLAVVAESLGISVLDINDPSSPVTMGYLNVSATSVTMDSVYAYAVSGFDFYVIDIRNPAQPKVIGQCTKTTMSSAERIYAVGPAVYILAGNLLVIDVTDPQNPVQISSESIPADDVQVRGNYLYVAAGDQGLKIYDISQPFAPFLVGGLVVPGTPIGVSVSGDIAYLATGRYDGLQIIDVSDPSNPELIAGDDTIEAYDVDVEGNFTYVATSENGLSIYDVTDPAAPLRIGQWDDELEITGMKRVLASDGFLYCVYRNNLYIIDTNTPSAPSLVALYGEPGVNGFRSMEIEWPFAYTTAWDTGVWIFDLSDPTNPSVVSQYETKGAALGITVHGDYAYVADGTDVAWWQSGGLRILDVSNPLAPTEVGALVNDHLTYARDVKVANGYAYVLSSGLTVVDVRNPLELSEVFFLELPAADITLSDHYAFVAAGSGGVFVINIENPANPVEVAHIDIDNALETQVVGPYLYIAAGTDGVRVYNISDAENPVDTGHYDSYKFSAEKIRVDGNYAYVPGGPLGLFVLDVSDPTRPIPAGNGRGKVAWERNNDIVFDIHGDVAFLANYDGIATALSLENPVSPAEYGTFAVLRTRINGISISGDRTILAHKQGLVILDTSHPEQPAEVGFYSPVDADSVVVVGDIVYAYDLYNLFVLDISDPATPQEIANLYTDAHVVRSVKHHEGHLYGAEVGTYGDGFRVIDVRDPENPEPVGYVSIDDAYSLSLEPPYAAVAAESGGLYMVDINDPTQPSVLSQVALPNSRRALGSALSWPYAFVAGNSSEFFIVDVSEPTNPWVLSQLESVYPLSLAVAPNFIVASGIPFTKLIDVSNPSMPTVMGRYAGARESIDYQDGLIYAGQDGLVILQYDPAFRADVNGDNQMTMADAIIALQCLSGAAASGSVRSDYVTSGQDINDDSQVGIEETLYIIQTISELRK